MANVVKYENDSFPKDQEFDLFGLFLVKNGVNYTLTDEDESKFEQKFSMIYEEYMKPRTDDDDTVVESKPITNVSQIGVGGDR